MQNYCLHKSFKKHSDTLYDFSPIKELIVKNNTQDRFYDEINKGTKIIPKFFKNFVRFNFHTDHDLYVEVKYNLKNLVK